MTPSSGVLLAYKINIGSYRLHEQFATRLDPPRLIFKVLLVLKILRGSPAHLRMDAAEYVTPWRHPMTKQPDIRWTQQLQVSTLPKHRPAAMQAWICCHASLDQRPCKPRPASTTIQIDSKKAEPAINEIFKPSLSLSYLSLAQRSLLYSRLLYIRQYK